MALAANGSRIADLNRAALAAIDANFTLTSLTNSFIFAGGVDLATGDRWRATTGTAAWFWRKVGGVFAPVTPVTEIAAGSNTVLVQGSGLTNANKLTTQTPTSISAAIPEFEGASSGALLVEISDENSGESQIALSVLKAQPDTQYEMMLRCVHDAGTTDVTFAAKFTTSSLKPFYADYSKFTSPELALQYNNRLRL